MGSAHRLLRKHPIMFAFGEVGSNPFEISTQKTTSLPNGKLVIFGGEHGIRTHETVLAVYTISNRAPSTSSDNSPYKLFTFFSALIL